MGIMVTHHGYNNGYNNPIYNAHKNAGAHYTWQNTSWQWGRREGTVLRDILMIKWTRLSLIKFSAESEGGIKND